MIRCGTCDDPITPDGERWLHDAGKREVDYEHDASPHKPRPVEPVVHSHITDGLHPDEPLASMTIYCENCGTMVHAANNECMTTWIETGSGNYCLPCFVALTNGVVDPKYALR